MKIVDSRVAMTRHSASWVRSAEAVGFVPTMGALHEGHLALIRRARRECRRVVVSIYVNPTQFGPKEDLARYPRPRQLDLALCRREGVDLVFAPKNLYLPDHSTFVEETMLSPAREGASRPGHFRGVATVVLKLFNLVRPTRAYFGQKDAQQVEVMRRMVRDLDVPVKIIVGPTVRGPDGVALSSRNRFLSKEERIVAIDFAKLLQRAAKRPADSARWLRERLKQTPDLKLDYVELAGNRLCAAVFVGKTRLIDNERIDLFNLPHHWCWTIQTLSKKNVSLIFTWHMPWKRRIDTGLGELRGTATMTGQVFNPDPDVKTLQKRLKKYKGKLGKNRAKWHLTLSEAGLKYSIEARGLPTVRVTMINGFSGNLYEDDERIGRIFVALDEEDLKRRRS
jgi:pantoate--beta-alanine ligase